MSIDLKTVQRTAALARLDLTWGLSPLEAPAALEKLAGELAGIVAHIDILAEADTDGISPLYSPMLEVPAPRPDRPNPGNSSDEILSQAPDRVGNLFAVPKII
jgi:aspartyl-tRNA(Asn)/glutamyl-tRNA(Gln) amidotransferase subunit C